LLDVDDRRRGRARSAELIGVSWDAISGAAMLIRALGGKLP